MADFDRDGRLDLVIQNLEKPAVLLMGRGEVGNWLQVDLDGSAPNRDALGAVVKVRLGGATLTRQVAAGSGFIGRSSPILHFGLGDAESVESLEIRWPSGAVEVRDGVSANQRIRLVEGAVNAAR